MVAIGNLVHQTSTTTGTGNLTLATLTQGVQTFNAAFGTGGSDVFYYFIQHQTAAEWEVGSGHLDNSTTLVRDTVIESSNSDALVNFSAGTKDVTCDLAGSKQAHTDLAQTLTNKTLTSPVITTPALGAASVDAITEIAAGLKSGSDGTLITGTAGTSGDLGQWNGDGDLVDGPTPPSGTIVGTSDTQTLTNKTINTASNTITVAAGDVSSGAFADARVAESNVTQHEAAIDHDALTNFVADEHVAHGGVTLTAGSGLTGGGTIAANRTFTVGAGTGITVNADDVEVSSNTRTATITFVIDGGGSAITTGIKGDVEVPFSCDIQEVRLLADQSGSIQVDIWKDTYANFPPTDADSITASAVPAISSATKYTDATLTGWTTQINAEDILRFNVDSITTIERCTVVLKVLKDS